MEARNCMFNAVAVITWCFMLKVGVSDPGINMLSQGCSTYNVSSLSNFNSNLNKTFGLVRTDLMNSSKHFATEQSLSGSDSVYAMFQCRDYMSEADCIACFSAASAQIRNCSVANGARVVYDGCFLRYERSDFYGETTRDANREYCGNQTTSSPDTTFNTTVASLLGDLQVATPRINGFFAASKREVAGSNLSVYAIAQCVQTIDSAGCKACMEVAYKNVQKCPPNADGRALDSGCFMRYSDKPFFADNQTINLLPFLKTESSSSSKKGAIIGGAAGGAALVLIIVGLFVWFKLSKKRKAAPRGNILDATELRGATVYSYKDLKSATKNFKEANKLGEGGFGDVYKSHLSTKFAGTLGYTAPEYALHGQLSEKVDTYSFGIVVLEIVSGKKSSEMIADPGAEYLLKKAWKLYEDGRHIELVDETLDPSEYEAEHAKKIIEIALMCTQSSPNSRPAMSEVVVLFKSRDSGEHTQPTRSPFVEFVERVPWRQVNFYCFLFIQCHCFFLCAVCTLTR
ncbi:PROMASTIGOTE SURFACE ANTIGEN PROTEIN PSA [Salix purpurea]|uniref:PROMASTIGOTE SURFACE ANTIGEN PROTEIN PSA n=1 Tax=Salix purpurea TaxID=77065 RepID=A0A9Q0URX5_SALPP|nr:PROMASTIGOTE SURFACE ANTIGEN PROTEIN PSA [Salix purpurea]